jgi:hypothetical protein
MERVADLSSLEAMAILEEAGVDLPATLNFKDETLRRFKNWRRLNRMRCGMPFNSERIRLKGNLPRQYEPLPDLIPGNVLDSYARDLSVLLRQLDMKPPRGRDDQWLENRGCSGSVGRDRQRSC